MKEKAIYQRKIIKLRKKKVVDLQDQVLKAAIDQENEIIAEIKKRNITKSKYDKIRPRGLSSNPNMTRSMNLVTRYQHTISKMAHEDPEFVDKIGATNGSLIDSMPFFNQ